MSSNKTCYNFVHSITKCYEINFCISQWKKKYNIRYLVKSVIYDNTILINLSYMLIYHVQKISINFRLMFVRVNLKAEGIGEEQSCGWNWRLFEYLLKKTNIFLTDTRMLLFLSLISCLNPSVSALTANFVAW